MQAVGSKRPIDGCETLKGGCNMFCGDRPRLTTLPAVVIAACFLPPLAPAVNPLVNPNFDVNLNGWTADGFGTFTADWAIDACGDEPSANARVLTLVGEAWVMQQLVNYSAGDVLKFSGSACIYVGPVLFGFFRADATPVAGSTIALYPNIHGNRQNFNVYRTVAAGDIGNLWVGIKAQTNGTHGYMNGTSITQLTPTPTPTAPPTSTPAPYTSVTEFLLYE